MGDHNEHVFEDELCQALVRDGWLYSPTDDGYDAERSLFPADIFRWLQDTQPDELAKVLKPNSSTAETEIARAVLLDRLCKVLDKPVTKEAGMLSVLRTGFKDVAAKFEMCQF